MPKPFRGSIHSHFEIFPTLVGSGRVSSMDLSCSQPSYKETQINMTIHSNNNTDILHDISSKDSESSRSVVRSSDVQYRLRCHGWLHTVVVLLSKLCILEGASWKLQRGYQPQWRLPVRCYGALEVGKYSTIARGFPMATLMTSHFLSSIHSS